MLLSALGLFTLVACQHEETEHLGVLPSDGVMRFNTNILETKAGATTENLVEFGLYVASASGEAYNANAKAMKPEGPSFWITDPLMRWKLLDEDVVITAYAPYDAAWDSKFSVQTDQSTEAGVIASDFLFASSMVNPTAPVLANPIHYDMSTKAVNVQMNHMLSKLTLTLNVKNSLTITEKPVVRIVGTNITGDVSMDDGAISNLSATEVVKMFTEPQNTATPSVPSETITYEAILLPQTNASGSFEIIISVLVGEGLFDEFVWNSTSEIIFEAKKNHTLSLTVGEEIAPTKSMRIEEWAGANPF